MRIFTYWRLKAITRDLKYLYALSFDFLTKNETRKQPRIEYSGKGSLKPDYDKPVCFFCSYDEESTVRRNVFHYLNELVQAGIQCRIHQLKRYNFGCGPEEIVGMLCKNNNPGE